MNFHYDSHINYIDDTTIISSSQGNSVFDELYSKWFIQEHSFGKCMVNYEVKMTFSNPLYSRVTKYFFDSIVVNINDAFEEACNQGYEQQMENAIHETEKRGRTIKEYLDDGELDELDKRMKASPNSEIAKREKELQKKKKLDPDFQWRADPRQNKRRVQSKSIYDDELSSTREDLELKRVDQSKNLIRGLFRENYLSRQDRDIVNKKMQDRQFLNDVYLLDQALGGAPDYKKKIAKHIKDSVES